MRYISHRLTVLVLLSASFAAFAKPAIALPDSSIGATALPSFQRLPDTQSTQLFQNLTPSASETFFKQGQLKLEQEVRLLGKQPELEAEDLLKVAPDLHRLQDTIPSMESSDIPRQTPPR